MVGISTSSTVLFAGLWGHGALWSPTARGSHLPLAPQGLEHRSHHPAGLRKRYNLRYLSVSAPGYTHKEIAVESARNGKHIFLEKPMALSLRNVRESINAAEKSRVKLFVGHCLRYWPGYVRVREAVCRGDIGEPRTARTYRLGIFPRSLWYGYMEYSGGVVVDMAIHDIDFLRWVLGPVKRVYGVGGRYTKSAVDAIDHAMYFLEFESGAIAYGEASWAMPSTFRFTTYLEIDGSKGLLSVDNRSTVSVAEYLEKLFAFICSNI